MSPRPLSRKRCTKGGITSRHWLAAVLAVALIGCAGAAFAAADKAAPIAVEKLQPLRVNGDQAPTGVAAPTGQPRLPGSPAAPSNDECSGAIAIPDGPYPVVSAAVDAIDATPQGSDDGPGLFPATCNGQGTDYTVWYTFTPSVTTLYTLSTCAATGATGNTVLDTVLAIFSSSDGTCGGAMTSLACNDSSACASPGDESTISALLTAGVTYYVVAGHWIPDGAITAGNSVYAIEIERSNAPGNDACAGAVALPLNRVVTGTTAAANNDFQSPLGCFGGIAGTQNPTTSPGRDVVYSFTAPADGSYSVRQVTSDPLAALRSQNPVLYAADNCPSGGGEVSGCIAAANRQRDFANFNTTGFNNNQAEELACLPMTSGQTIYVFFDDAGTGTANGGGPLGVEVTPCFKEVEPNDTTASATAYGFCDGVEGSSSSAPSYHCVLGVNAGAPCQTTAAGAGVPPPPNCGGAPGLCFPDSVCEGGHQPGAACVPTCVGGDVHGSPCTATAQCTGGGACQTSGGCGICTAGLNTGQPCVNNVNCGLGGICNVGVCSRTGNEGDVDFYSLGTPPAESRVYAVVHANMSNDNDFRMRVTSDTSTLFFDDDDGHTRSGSLSATIAGAKTTGSETFVKVSRTAAIVSEPYRLHAIVQPPIAAAQPEGTASDNGEGWDITFGWPGDGLFADYLSNGANTGYIRGSFFATTDGDCYIAMANEGDSMMWFGDSNPNSVDATGANSNPQIIIYDAAAAGISNFVFTTGLPRNIGPFAGAPGLNATVPQSTSFFQHWRARYSGLFTLCFYGFSNAFNGNGPYAGSLTSNCGPMAPAGPGTTTTDVSVTKVGPAGPVPTSGVIDYTITITNNGSEIAQKVQLVDVLPPELLFLGLGVDDGFNGNNTACSTLPDPGTQSDPIDCTTMSLAPGASATYTLTVQVAPCGPGGVDVTNTVNITTVSTDPDPSNDSDSHTFATAENNQCAVLTCDSSGCIVDACQINDRCESGQCVSDPLNCDDGTVCTDDSCNSVTGCFNDPSPGQQCNDGNVCTSDFCDPVDFCVFPPAPAGIECNDFFNCTNNDACDGNGNCAGLSVCDDGDSCTEDFADEFNNCACFNFPTGEGTPCNDGDACTEGETCDASFTCVGGTAVDCNDDDPCTNDSCDPDSGCVNAPVSCDDGNACTTDSCDSTTGACTYAPVICNDDNGCTDDSCDPGSGCVYDPNNAPCDDGDACTTVDFCSDGSCQSSGVLDCDDNEGCTDDSCDPSSGCVYTNNTAACDDGNGCTTGDICGGGTCLGGAPVVCTPLDQCHDAGVCDPGSGTCSNPAKPDGTVCDDGNPTTTGDVCTAGICGGSSCPDAPDPKTKGWYKSLCNNSHSGDSLTDADAACVASITDTFSGISTVADICNVIHPGVAEGNNGDDCGREEDQLMVLALNICKQRLCGAFAIDSNCGSGSEDVGSSLAEMDAIFSDPDRDRFSCDHGGCLGEEINNGRALELNTLNLSRESGSFRLSWLAPSIDDGQGAPKNYTVWRRLAGTTNPFQQIGSTTGLTFVDATGGTSSWQYLVKVHH
jgi:uncharacterized repeat protein (TIGR01451 family)